MNEWDGGNRGLRRREGGREVWKRKGKRRHERKRIQG